MEKSKAKPTSKKKHYWGITREKEVIFSGSFKDCWEQLCKKFTDYPVRYLMENNIKIERIG